MNVFMLFKIFFLIKERRFKKKKKTSLLSQYILYVADEILLCMCDGARE